MKNSTIRFALILLAGALLGAAGLHWRQSQNSNANASVPPASSQPMPVADAGIAVEATQVEAVTLSRSVAAVGSLHSENAVVLRPEIAGRIAAINFEEGGAVTRGQVLIRLDDSVLRAQFEQSRAALALASSQYRRAQELNRQGFISKQARDESASQLKVQQAAMALAKAQLDKTVITAPFDGLIGWRKVSVGDYVSPGSDLAPLESIDPLNVDFRVPEQLLGQVQVGTRIALRFDALADVRRDAVVGAISPLVDVGGRSILLRAKVPNSDALLRPGISARVQLQFDDKAALMVPEAAISPAGDMNYVYRVEGEHAAKVGVMLGQRQDGKVEIIDGLADGDQVLVSGLQKVFDGAQIRILPATADNS